MILWFKEAWGVQSFRRARECTTKIQRCAEGSEEGVAVVEADQGKHEDSRSHLNQEPGRASYFPSPVRGATGAGGRQRFRGGDGREEAVSLWGGGR